MKEKLIRKANLLALKFDKNKPQIYIGLGIVGLVVGTVLTCKATDKAEEVFDDHEENIDALHNAKECGDLENEKEYRKDLALTYVKTGAELAKIYIPPVMLATSSAFLILKGHNILQKRYFAVSSAYTALQKEFGVYRKRIADSYGEEAEKDIFYGLKKESIEQKEVDEEGREEIKKVEADVADKNVGPYAKFFDATSREWKKDPEYNLMFLRAQEKAANVQLRMKGFLTLNEVYEALDIPETKEGMIAGWIYDDKNPSASNYVDFGIYENPNRYFVNGIEPVILLDFNATGNIYDML